jgi:NADPH-dependent 2,4-dienoyl-CoA reductase/sulfur reductase-like enzyme
VSGAGPRAGNLRRMDTEPPAAAPSVEPFLSLPDTADHRVVIVGAGFAGLRLARRLAGKRGFQVVLLDRHNYHTFQPLL